MITRFLKWFIPISMLLPLHSGGSLAAQDDPELPRDALWRVVQICERAFSILGIPTPCIAVQSETELTKGYALVPTPGKAEILLVPTSKTRGIESTELMTDAAPDWWDYAWEARRYLENRVSHPLARDEIGLAINSAGARSQDQLHIHIACVSVSVKRHLARFAIQARDDWTPFPGLLVGQKYLWRRLIGSHLRGSSLSSTSGSSETGSSAAQQGLAVVGWTFASGEQGFLLLSNQRNDLTGDRGAGSDILDPDCSGYVRDHQ